MFCTLGLNVLGQTEGGGLLNLPALRVPEILAVFVPEILAA
jgi:hypothetical protein